MNLFGNTVLIPASYAVTSACRPSLRPVTTIYLGNVAPVLNDSTTGRTR
jgi:hypothetical protein